MVPAWCGDLDIPQQAPHTSVHKRAHDDKDGESIQACSRFEVERVARYSQLWYICLGHLFSESLLVARQGECALGIYDRNGSGSATGEEFVQDVHRPEDAPDLFPLQLREGGLGLCIELEILNKADSKADLDPAEMMSSSLFTSVRAEHEVSCEFNLPTKSAVASKAVAWAIAMSGALSLAKYRSSRMVQDAWV